MQLNTYKLLGLLGLLVLGGCGQESPGDSTGDQSGRIVTEDFECSQPVPDPIVDPQLVFNEVELSEPVRFVYRNGQEAERLAILESLGGGVGVIDFDADGQWDLFFPGGGFFDGDNVRGHPSGLLWNRGGWQFENCAATSGVEPSPHYSHGAAVCDFDNDGFQDLLLTGYGGVQLFHNQGDGTFLTVSDPALATDSAWSSSAAWGDFNRDSIPDVYVAHYVDWSFENHPECRNPAGDRPDICPPRSFNGLPDRLYLGQGDGSFRDATGEFGLRIDGKGLGVLAADFDRDGDVDVYVTNDTTENFLYLNSAGQRFEEQGKLSGVALNDAGHPDGSMGVDAGDFDGDGELDLCVSNYERESTALYRNMGKGNFLHVSQALGVASVGSRYVGWGTSVADFDLDGDEELFIANGHVIRFPLDSTVVQHPLLFENRGAAGRRFENVSPTAGNYFRAQHQGRGAARGDFDRDGRVDLAISHTQEPIAILANRSGSKSHTVTVQLIGRDGMRQPVGAVVKLRQGDRVQMRSIQGGGSYASTHAAEVTFGLGASPVFDELSVVWPSGAEQTFADLSGDRWFRIVEGSKNVFEMGTTTAAE